MRKDVNERQERRKKKGRKIEPNFSIECLLAKFQPANKVKTEKRNENQPKVYWNHIPEHRYLNTFQ